MATLLLVVIKNAVKKSGYVGLTDGVEAYAPAFLYHLRCYSHAGQSQRRGEADRARQVGITGHAEQRGNSLFCV